MLGAKLLSLAGAADKLDAAAEHIREAAILLDAVCCRAPSGVAAMVEAVEGQSAIDVQLAHRFSALAGTLSARAEAEAA
jgi:hypothetical protein